MLLTLDGIDYNVSKETNGWFMYETCCDVQVQKKSIRRKLRQMYQEASIPRPICPLPTSSLGSLFNEALTPIPQRSTNMYSEMKVQEISADDQARDHLRTRLRDVFGEKEEALRVKYGISQTVPKTLGELAKALKDGQYTIDGLKTDADSEKEIPWFYSPGNVIRWTLIPEDAAGFTAAVEILEKARVAAKDSIIVSTPKEGLEILRAFEAQTFS